MQRYYQIVSLEEITENQIFKSNIYSLRMDAITIKKILNVVHFRVAQQKNYTKVRIVEFSWRF